MTMTNDEIVREYELAKAPTKQIRILADLNVCDRKDIIKILTEAGCKLPGNCVPGKPSPKSRSKGVPLAAPEKPKEDDDLDTMFLSTDSAPRPARDAAPKPKKLPGAKSDAGKLQLSTVPPELVKAVAAIRAYGNSKYSDPDNWRWVDPERFHEAMLRHTLAVWEDWRAVDPESGLPHLWHLLCNGAFLCAMMEAEHDT